KRMIKLMEEGCDNEIVQETRGWDEAKGKTFSQRKKETSDDYRYFPEPDLPKLKISEIPEFDAEKLKAELPELPDQKREKLATVGIAENQIDFLVRNIGFGKYFDEISEVVSDKKQITLVANYLSSDVVSLMKDDQEVSLDNLDKEQFIEMIKMISNDEISSRGAKDILAILIKEGGNTREIAEEKGLMQQSDAGALKEIAQKIISENESVVEDFKNGKEAAMQFLIGQGMKETRGSANPQVLKDIFTELIK
ncbi:MAG: Asp-tRNA(Asn)/Glu-tRNA(Gln) amidotransferase subunit GatB, partial [Bacteriovoracia bacterium]